MDNSVIAKSGWLFRQSTTVKKWKKKWVELYRDGHLKYYESDQSPTADDVMFMPTDCLTISTGSQVEGVQPPEGFSAQSLFSVVTSTGKTWVFCGENVEEMRAWQLALEEGRLSGMHQRPARMSSMRNYHSQTVAGDPYATHYAYHPNYYSHHPGYMVPQQQPTTVIYQQPPYYYHNPGTDVALGMMAGATLGHMMWSPFFWW